MSFKEDLKLFIRLMREDEDVGIIVGFFKKHKWWYVCVGAFLGFVIISQLALAINLELDPPSFSITISPNETRNYSFTITNYDNDTTNISFESNYTLNFTPNYFNISNDTIGVNFILKGPPDVGTYTDEIMIYNNGTETASIVLELDVKYSEGYVFKKCWFDDNGAEICEIFNISEMTNVTVVQNLTEYKLYTFDQESVKLFTDAINESVNRMENLSFEQRKYMEDYQNHYKNANTIESLLNNPNYTTWRMLEPTNDIINYTGLNPNDFYTAVGILQLHTPSKVIYKEGVIEQSYQSGTAVITNFVPAKYVASAQRVANEEREASIFWNNVILSGFVIIVMFICGVWYWNKHWRVKKIRQ